MSCPHLNFQPFFSNFDSIPFLKILFLFIILLLFDASQLFFYFDNEMT